MKILLKISKYFFLIIILILSIFLLWQSVLYISSPVYTFLPSSPFNGKKIYNPYQNTDSAKWKKGVFHLHSNAWSILTDGRKNDKDTILDRYKTLGYDLVSLADYQKISKLNDDKISVISSYEHGYNLRKTHQLSLGVDRVTWKDFFFYQNINHKQDMIYTLKERCKVLSINHPRMNNSYTAEDLKYLRGYNLFEAMNHLRFSIDLWDTVLSSGIPAFIIANDDCHDIYNPTLFGMCCTFIQDETHNTDSILNNLKCGHAYGVELAFPSKDILVRAEYHKNIPKLHCVELEGDTLMRVITNHPSKVVYFIGQNGIKLDSVFDSDKAEYHIKEKDSYIRTEIFFEDHTRLLLNPLFKYDNEKVFEIINPVNKKATFIKRLVYISVLTLLFAFILWFRKSLKKRKISKQRF